jgi:hypothetical protein
MIHIATVHWKDDRWVDVQIKYLQKNLESPFRIYAFLNNLPEDHSGKYFYSSIEPIKQHAVKLNVLADIIAFASDNDNDIIMFLDGDAFPIKALDSFLTANIEKHKLIAVQRLENNRDIQPHPSFCATTMKFWKELKGDWKKGFEWETPQGEKTTDVGGYLLKELQKRHIDWHPLLRTNRHNEYHPLFFGIYDDIIYHHGAGFRKGGFSRSDRNEWKKKTMAGMLNSAFFSRFPGKGLFSSFSANKPPKKYRRKIREMNRMGDEQIYKLILEDDCFYEMFL